MIENYCLPWFDLVSLISLDVFVGLINHMLILDCYS